MNNLQNVKKWCEENNIIHEEDLENGVVHLTNKIDYEGFKKAKRLSISIFEIMKVKQEHLDTFIESISKELHTFNRE